MSTMKEAFLVDIQTTLNDASVKTVRITVFAPTGSTPAQVEAIALTTFDHHNAPQALGKVWPYNIWAIYVSHA